MENLKISSHEQMKNLAERYICQGCDKSVKYYCYRCSRTPLDLPKVKLPLKLTILQHSRELEGKSTAVHAKLLAPDQVEIIKYNKDLHCITDDINSIKDDTAILFPSKTSVSVKEVDWGRISRLLVIDGTWQQAKSMLNDPKLKYCQQVHLSNTVKGHFWRYQNIGPHCLSTIEAIHAFFKEFDSENNLDDLLYLFVFQYNLIQEQYKKIDQRYTSKHRFDYIKYDL